MPHPLKVNWQNECHKPSDSTSSSFLQVLTNRPGISLQEGEPGLRNIPSTLSRQQGGNNLVGHTDDKLEWQDGANDRTQPDHRIGCLNPRLGSLSPEHSTGGPWSPLEKEWHINCLELLAATLALKTFVKHKTGISVLMKIDNTTAVAYINNQGGAVSKELISLTRDLWMWCLERNIHIQAQYLPGVMNQTADRESRSMKDRSDWSLDDSTFQRINRLYGPLEVDLFASRLTNQCHRYFSWRADPIADATDAFLQDWRTIKGFANSPWNLIPRVLMKT